MKPYTVLSRSSINTLEREEGWEIPLDTVFELITDLEKLLANVESEFAVLKATLLAAIPSGSYSLLLGADTASLTGADGALLYGVA